MRMAVVACLGFAIASGAATAQPVDALKELLTYNTCRVVAQMKAVYERPAGPRDRSVILRVESALERYLRCDFVNGGGRLICQLSPPRKPDVDQVAALTELGFAAESPLHDLRYERALTGTPNFEEISRFMLTALHRAHDVKEETPLTIIAPFTGTLIYACRY